MISRKQARDLVASRSFQNVITAVIIANAITLGLEPSRIDGISGLADTFNSVAMGIFIFEIILKLYAHDVLFFARPWNLFDFAVVGIAIAPLNGVYSVLRLLRVLPMLRHLPGFPTMGFIVGALSVVVRGFVAFVVLLCMAIYPAAIMATNTFRTISPQHFENIGASTFTLFQILTGYWADVVRQVMYEAPVESILIVTFVVFAVVVGVKTVAALIIYELETYIAADRINTAERRLVARTATRQRLLNEIRALRLEVSELAGMDDHAAAGIRELPIGPLNSSDGGPDIAASAESGVRHPGSS